MTNHELCVNLWYFVDIKNQLVSALAGRAYYLQGDDDSKTAQLKTLAAHDFLLTTWLPIPENITTHIVDNSSGEKLTFVRTIHAMDIDRFGIDLFSDVFQQIESTAQDFQPLIQAGKNVVPDALMYVMTAVYLDAQNQLVTLEQ